MLKAIPPPNTALTPSKPPVEGYPVKSKREKELEYELRRKDRIIDTLT